MSLSKKALDKRRATTKAWQLQHPETKKIYARRFRVRHARARRLADLKRIHAAARLMLTVVTGVIHRHQQGSGSPAVRTPRARIGARKGR